MSLSVDDELNRWQKYAYGKEAQSLNFSLTKSPSAGCSEWVVLKNFKAI